MRGIIASLLAPAPNIPIYLADDGLTVSRDGHTASGGYRFTCFHNPELVGVVVGIRTERTIIKETNIRQWS